jgi:hypothetical protein
MNQSWNYPTTPEAAQARHISGKHKLNVDRWGTGTETWHECPTQACITFRAYWAIQNSVYDEHPPVVRGEV